MVGRVSTLNSNSTLDEIQASYADNASYEEDGAATKARAFITACRLLVLKLPKRSAVGGGGAGAQELELDVPLIQGEMAAAKAWLAANDTATNTGQTKHVDFTDFRR